MERERYDGADVAHLLRAHGDRLDWPRLLRRFGPHWRVLLSHLVLFGFIYPGERALVPAWVMDAAARAPAPRDAQRAGARPAAVRRHAAVARAVPARHRATGLSRRPPHSARQHDRQRCGRVDRRDPRAAEAAATRPVVTRTGTARPLTMVENDAVMIDWIRAWSWPEWRLHPWRHVHGAAGGRDRRGARLRGASDQLLGAGRVRRGGALGQRRAGPRAARPARRLATRRCMRASRRIRRWRSQARWWSCRRSR